MLTVVPNIFAKIVRWLVTLSQSPHSVSVLYCILTLVKLFKYFCLTSFSKIKDPSQSPLESRDIKFTHTSLATTVLTDDALNRSNTNIIKRVERKRGWTCRSNLLYSRFHAHLIEWSNLISSLMPRWNKCHPSLFF